MFLHDGEGFREVFRELHTSSDRVVGIVGGALIEDQLARALVAHLGLDRRAAKAVFEFRGPLGTFAKKITRGFESGVYGATARDDLVRVKDIRNAFAHELETRTFADETIRDRAIQLTLAERYSTSSPEDFGRPGERGSVHPKEWRAWTGSARRDAQLADPRQRFVLELSVLAQGLSMATRPVWTAPYF